MKRTTKEAEEESFFVPVKALIKEVHFKDIYYNVKYFYCRCFESKTWLDQNGCDLLPYFINAND